MLSRLKKEIQNLLHRRGRFIGFYPVPQYLSQFGIDCVLDVGANIGQTGDELRTLGYRGQICSFEPQSKAYAELEKRARRDSNWTTYPYGLGSDNSVKPLNISGMGPSSSFLNLSKEAVEALPDIRFVDSEQVKTSRLDDVFEDVCGNFRNVFLKIDTQGYERHVMEGALGVLDRICGLQLELSLVLQYEGETPAEEMMSWIRSLGFSPYWFLPGHRNFETMQLFQIDLIFFRNR